MIVITQLRKNHPEPVDDDFNFYTATPTGVRGKDFHSEYWTDEPYLKHIRENRSEVTFILSLE